MCMYVNYICMCVFAYNYVCVRVCTCLCARVCVVIHRVQRLKIPMITCYNRQCNFKFIIQRHCDKLIKGYQTLYKYVLKLGARPDITAALRKIRLESISQDTVSSFQICLTRMPI